MNTPSEDLHRGETRHVSGYAFEAGHIRQPRKGVTSFSRGLIEVQEQERSRIARELHDDIVQRLAMLTMRLEQLKEYATNEPHEIRTRLAELSSTAFDISVDVQNLSRRLHPPKLKYLGVVAAMKSHCEEIAGQHRVKVEFSHTGVPAGVSPDVSLCFFRILQEALHNGLEHGGAGRFSVRMMGTADAICLSIRDYGRGFDVEAAETGGGLGLTSMRERCHAFGGTLIVRSKPDWGTEVIARVPLSEAQSVEALRVA